MNTIFHLRSLLAIIVVSSICLGWYTDRTALSNRLKSERIAAAIKTEHTSHAVRIVTDANATIWSLAIYSINYSENLPVIKKLYGSLAINLVWLHEYETEIDSHFAETYSGGTGYAINLAAKILNELQCDDPQMFFDTTVVAFEPVSEELAKMHPELFDSSSEEHKNLKIFVQRAFEVSYPFDAR